MSTVDVSLFPTCQGHTTSECQQCLVPLGSQWVCCAREPGCIMCFLVVFFWKAQPTKAVQIDFMSVKCRQYSTANVLNGATVISSSPTFKSPSSRPKKKKLHSHDHVAWLVVGCFTTVMILLWISGGRAFRAGRWPGVESSTVCSTRAAI